MALHSQFGGAFGGVGGSRRNELVSFNAGKMVVKQQSNGKFLVSPDLKKGKICLTRGDDQLLHFQWVDRLTGATPEDFIIFPDDASFSKVDTGRAVDRVLLLQYKNSSRRFFFWMQHKDSSRDDELVKKVNDCMNNANQAGSDSGRSGAGNVQLDHNAIMQMLGAMGAGGDHGRGGQNPVQMSELQNILQNMGLPASNPSAASSPATSSSTQVSQNGGGSSAAATVASTTHDHDVGGMEVDDMSEEELLRLAIEESMRDVNEDRSTEGAPTPATPAPASAPVAAPTPAPAPILPPARVNPAPAGGEITTADLQRAMAALQQMAQPKTIKLTKLLTPDNVKDVLNDPVCVAQLVQHLPEGAQTAFELQATLSSPQLRQSIGSLVGALQSGNFNSVMTNFGLDPAAGADKLAFGDSVGAFLAAIQRWADQQNTTMEDASNAPSKSS
ncbi:TPA: hypothetical protein N0F65_003353 [Lagenidium giganteum]|uniref:Uncharacterized protein n=1 Tax=Lagenidium giganteum TaxID=4803 RepID=A0AAV2Z9X7_9STRA|nr:TPA: hypothetical protein N0F65_003353 [Lagenidium giganteum]